MTLRVLLYSTTYPGEAGGVQHVVKRLGDRLRRSGHETVIAWAAPNPDASVGDEQLSLPRLHRVYGVPRPGSLVQAGRAVKSLAARLRRLRPDVVNIHFIDCAAAYFVLLRPIFRYKLVLTAHGSDLLRPHPWDEAVLPWVLRKADAVIAVSDHLAAEARRRAGAGAAGVTVVRNGIDFPFWSACPREERPPGSEPVVLTVGRLHPVKGQDVLLQAFRKVLASFPSARLVLVGDGPAGETLRRQAASLQLGESVEFAGAQDEEAIRARMTGAAVFVLPSRSEGLSLALLEAMAAGVPVVATGVGGVPDVLTAGTGLLVPPEDPANLAEAIAAVLHDPAAAADRARHARDRARAYSVAATNDAYEAVFTALAALTTRAGDRPAEGPSISLPGES